MFPGGEHFSLCRQYFLFTAGFCVNLFVTLSLISKDAHLILFAVLHSPCLLSKTSQTKPQRSAGDRHFHCSEKAVTILTLNVIIQGGG